MATREVRRLRLTKWAADFSRAESTYSGGGHRLLEGNSPLPRLGGTHVDPQASSSRGFWMCPIHAASFDKAVWATSVSGQKRET